MDSVLLKAKLLGRRWSRKVVKNLRFPDLGTVFLPWNGLAEYSPVVHRDLKHIEVFQYKAV